MNSANKKKSYKELKANPVIKAPLLAWILDRKAVYISVTLVGCLAAGAFVYQGWQSYQDIIAPPTDTSPYRVIDPAESQGVRWASNFMADSYGVADWEVKDSIQPNHGFMQDATGSTAGEVPVTLLATRVASAGPVKGMAQIYGAGQARKQYDFYVSKLSARGSIDSKKVSDGGIYGAKFENGFIFVAGDTIVGAQTADNGQRDKLFGDYLSSLEKTLPQSGCASVSGDDESKRSIYFDPNSFQGLLETRKIDPQVNTDHLPTVQGIGAKDVSNPYATQPEGPLPASLPKLPSEVAKPTVDNAPATVNSFQEEAAYRVKDPVGPGCGWDWSAQKPLRYNEADLKAAKQNTLTKVQNDVNGKAQSYVDSKIKWARLVALVAPQLDSWNHYVEDVDSVHAKWDKLTKDRQALRPAWDQYISDHELWNSFDARKASAEQSYSDAQDQCLADRKAHDEWETEWGTDALKKKQDAWRAEQEAQKPKPSQAPSADPTATPSPTPSESSEPSTPMPTAPPEPADCTGSPVRPAILDQQKPAEPAPPAIPEDVTVPSSWPQP